MKAKEGFDFITDYKYANVKTQIEQYHREAAQFRRNNVAHKSLSLRIWLGISIARLGLAIARPELQDLHDFVAAHK